MLALLASLLLHVLLVDAQRGWITSLLTDDDALITLRDPFAVAFYDSEKSFVSDSEANVIFSITGDGILAVFAGDLHAAGFTDGTSPLLYAPCMLILSANTEE